MGTCRMSRRLFGITAEVLCGLLFAWAGTGFCPAEGAGFSTASAQETSAMPAAQIGGSDSLIETNSEEGGLTPIAPQSEKDPVFGNESKPNFTKTFTSLFLVLGILFTCFYLVRRFSPKTKNPIPAELLETIGEFPLSGRIRGRILRFGSKLILVAVGPDGAEPLAELTNPQEVAALWERCKKRNAQPLDGTKEARNSK